jgi:hypothetical protein
MHHFMEIPARWLTQNRPMCGNVQKDLVCKAYNWTLLPYASEIPVTDVYVYYFMRCRGSAGEKILSKRRATLEAIKGNKDEAVMESQIVVDHTEVDDNGFVIGGVGNESHPMDERWAEIRSLERRANSRDSEALTLNESGDGQHIYLLRLESRELRNQAQRLKKQRANSMAGEFGIRSDAHDFVPFGSPPVSG